MAKDSEQSGAGVTSGAAAGADDKDPAHEAHGAHETRGEEAVDKTTSAPDSKDQEANAAEGAPAKPARKSGAKAGSKTGPTEKKTHRRVKSKTAKSADSAIPKRKRGSTKKAASAPEDAAPAAAVSADSKAAGPRGAGSNTAGSGTTGPKSGGPKSSGPRVVVAPHAAPVTKTDKDRKAPSGDDKGGDDKGGDAKAKANGKSGDGKGLGAGAASTAAGAGAVASTDTLEIPRKTAKPAGPAGASGDGKGASGKEAGKESNRSKAPAAGGSDKESVDRESVDRESADRGLAGKDGGDRSSDAAAGATLTAVGPAAVSAVRGSRRRPWPIVIVLLLLVLAGVTVVVNPKILQHSAVHDRLASIRGLLGFEQAAAPVPKTLGSQELSEMESLLSELGLEPGRVDGVIDGQTRSAISEFQEMGGLPVDGEPTGALLFELREVAGALNGG